MKSLKRRGFLATLLTGLLQVVCYAQQSLEQPGGSPLPAIVQPLPETEENGLTPTLPPVEVRPPFGSIPEQATETSDSFFPPLEPQLGSIGPFGANTGILRGAQSLFDTPGSLSVRTHEEITERQATDMFQALQNEVGVLLQSTAAGQASPFIRGLTGQQVLILVDGIRLNNSIFRRGPNQYFNTIDPGMVDHIEVLRGQGSVLWGSDAIGGAINIVTRGSDSHRGMYHEDYMQPEFTQYYNTSNSSPYSRLNVEGWVGSTGVFAGGSYSNVRDLDTGFENYPRQPGSLAQAINSMPAT